MSPVSNGEFAVWMACLVALVIIGERVVALINGVKLLRQKPHHRRLRVADRFVTKAELKEVRGELSQRIDKVEKYTQDGIHQLRGELHMIGLKVTAIAVKTGADKVIVSPPEVPIVSA
jgi:hypothetical protein